MNKRAISPVIATVLMIVIILILAVIIFLWAGGFTPEEIAKFGEPISRACDMVDMDVSFDGYEISVDNTGDVGLYGLSIEYDSSGDTEVDSCYKEIPVGRTGDCDFDGEVISVKPILKGDKGEEYVCDDTEFFP